MRGTVAGEGGGHRPPPQNILVFHAQLILIIGIIYPVYAGLHLAAEV